MTRFQPRFWRRWLPLALFGALAVSGCGSSDDSANAFAPGTGGTADGAGAGGTAGSAGTRGDGAAGAGGDQLGDPPGVEAAVPGFFTNPFEELFADPDRSPLDDTSTLEAAAEYADAARAYLPMLPRDTYPYLHAMSQHVIDGSHDGLHDFAFGLELILDGLEELPDEL